MNWDDIDQDQFIEYVKFDDPPASVSAMFDDIEELYCNVDWDSLEEFTNQWNNKQMRVKIAKYKNIYHPELNPELMNIDFYLAMGKRLLKEMKKFHTENPKRKNIRIRRIGKDFKTQYSVKAYDIKKQKVLKTD